MEIHQEINPRISFAVQAKRKRRKLPCELKENPREFGKEIFKGEIKGKRKRWRPRKAQKKSRY
ncbi:hypothetical protein PSY31_22410, partial [Shigella flexneri]|nr:hypothetical protein [Shigella flexneri]